MNISQASISEAVWTLAFQLYAQNQLSKPAVVLIDEHGKFVAMLNAQLPDSDFRDKVFEEVAARNLRAAAYVANVNFSFEALPDGTKPFPDHEALTVVSTDPNGWRTVESCRTYRGADYVEFGEKMPSYMPAVIVDEIFAGVISGTLGMPLSAGLNLH